ncbi:MAG: carboxylic acid reductase [Mycobacteriaceae bacterium]|nr:carboxylic acid reductase [Mycobacteriaceae bacterium]
MQIVTTCLHERDRGMDAQVRDTRPLDTVAAAVIEPGRRLSQIVETVMRGYADRPALGQRAHELVTDRVTGRTSLRLLPEFETITYRDLWDRVGAVATEWNNNLQCPVSAGDFVCILGFTSTDYTTVDLACLYLGAVSVSLQTSAPAAQHVPIIAETRPAILAVGIDSLDTAVAAVLAGTAPQRLIVFDYEPRDDDHRDRFQAARRRLSDAGSPVVVDTLADVIERGRAVASAPLYVPQGAEDNPVLSLYYTSGSTGTPKGAIYTEKMLSFGWLRHTGLLTNSDVPMIIVSYLPMSHLAGHGSVVGTLASGGTAYFAAKSDISTLFEDIALVRPTVLNLVPRVCEMIYQHYLGEVDMRIAGGADPHTVEAEVKAQMRQNFLGGRVLAANCGTAPLAPELAAFVESLLDMHLTDGYGSTEAGMVLTDHVVQRPPVLDYQLVDVPELGYFRTDHPHPRGELLVKTEFMTPGYYNRPDVTAEMFDADGFYRTGDIMAEVGPDQLVYVDRRNNVLKLAQGEFVALSHLEAVLAASPLIRQIFVYGTSERSFLLAVVVPTPEALAELGGDGVDRLKGAVGESLQRIATDARLNGYEIPRDFLIETEPFSTENGLLSGAGKLLRPKLKAHYGERLEQMYADMVADQADELRALRTASADRPVLETLSRAVGATLGLAPGEVSLTSRFIDLGGDSLSALSFSNLLTDIFGIEVPVGVVINPASDLQQLANYIDTQRHSGAKRPTFAGVHGRDSTEVYAGDLTLDKFIDEHTLALAPTLPRPTGEIRTVLLTGATGYLGRFLALEWLQRLAPSGGRLICIARGSDTTQARSRIEAALDTDPELIRRFGELAADHLEVLPGDIGEPNLGLDQHTWNRLAETVDLIVHPAAHVNHVLPYHHLFGANVVGTAELIRLAITTKIKPLDYTSTVAAAFVGDDVIDEDSDVRLASPVRKLEGSYANGYAISKWAGEVLMREAHDLCGLPGAVFRCDMILADSRYAGQLNVPDVFTRLLFSLVATGIAPGSFYRFETDGDRPRAHYDGLPVDFVAAAITGLGVRAMSGFRTYNVVNPHDDGISLDQFVDWLIEAGHPIQRIDDYDEWVSRFQTAMRALPDKRRQHSVLPVLDAYRHPAEAVRGSAVPATGFAAAQRIPHLSAALIRKYITDLHGLGLL